VVTDLLHLCFGDGPSEALGKFSTG
jgi:hypothetical protein